MLDLDARVHLDEIELAVLVEEFDGADAEIPMSRIALATVSPMTSRAATLSAGEGLLLESFLMPALNRAVALAEMDGVALAVAQHLDFDVARLFQIFFQIDGVIAERGFRLARAVASAVDNLPARARRPSCRGRRRPLPP